MMRFKISGLTIITLFLSFLLAFIAYLLTLAPSVTFEDSGELIAAAYNLGIPHQPGYPLFTLSGRLFSLIPLGTIASRLNLMSAFFSAIAAMFISWSTLLLIKHIGFTENSTARQKSGLGFLKYATALAAGVLAMSSFELWEQSIITEVYGLNTLFASLYILLILLWKQQTETNRKIHYFLMICYLCGLALANHTSSILFIPVLIIFMLLDDRRIFTDIKSLLAGSFLFVLGLTPYIYLPLASARNPWMDWGNPENWTNFIRTVSRHQYGLTGSRSFNDYLAQLETYGDLFLQQWVIWLVPLVVCLSAYALYFLLRKKDSTLYFFILFFVFMAPVTTYLTNFDVTVADAFVANENKALVSVFYIPSYIVFAILTGLGTFYVIQKFVSSRIGFTFTALIILILPLTNVISRYTKLDMSNYTYSEDYVRNLFVVAEKNSVIFANWDPFYFPLNYFQFVENVRPDIIAIDQQLLRRSWYIRWLRDHYPDFMVPVETQVDAFLEAVKPFEEKKPYDGNFIQTRYIGMINAIIDAAMASGRPVFFTYSPPPEIQRNYSLESVLVSLRLLKNNEQLPAVDLADFKFRNYDLDRPDPDRWINVFRNYYGGLFISRGQRHEQAGEWEGAIAIYYAARIFYTSQPAAVKNIEDRISMLRSRNME
jgi:hypothetical protein